MLRSCRHARTNDVAERKRRARPRRWTPSPAPLVLLLVLLSRAARAQYLPPRAREPGRHLLDRRLGRGWNETESIARRSTDSQSASNPNLYLVSHSDFCLYGPPDPFNYIWNTGTDVVAWCAASGHGARLIPDGTLHGVTYVKADSWVQVSGSGDFTKINIAPGDAGGQFDSLTRMPDGATVYTSDSDTASSWVMLISATTFCFRACSDATFCPNTYDQMGCYFYTGDAVGPDGTWQDCSADDGDPPGVVGGTTYTEGQSPVPTPTAPPVSACSSGGSASNGQTQPPLYSWDGSGTAVPISATATATNASGGGGGGASSGADSGGVVSTTWIQTTACACSASIAIGGGGSSAASTTGGTTQVGVTQVSEIGGYQTKLSSGAATTATSAAGGSLSDELVDRRLAAGDDDDGGCCWTTWVVSTISAAQTGASSPTTLSGASGSATTTTSGGLVAGTSVSASKTGSVSGSGSTAKISGSSTGTGLTQGNATNSTGGNASDGALRRVYPPITISHSTLSVTSMFVGALGIGLASGWALI